MSVKVRLRTLVLLPAVSLVLLVAGAFTATGNPIVPTPRSGPAPASAPVVPGTLVYLKGWTSDVGLGGWRYQIWTMRADGSAQRQVTADPDLQPFSAAANPAGNRIAFTVGRSSRLSVSGLYLVALDGSGRTNLLAKQRQVIEAQNPTWSPDGKRLAFVGYDSSFRKDIWVVDANGRNLRRVTRCDCAYANAPKWSPTSKNTIAWTPTSAGAQTGLSLLNVSTGVSTQLYDSTASGALTVLDYSWELVGPRIAFTGGRFNQTSPKLYTIVGTPGYVGEPRPLSTNAPSTLSMYAPVWSPDRTTIAVSAIDGSGTSTSGQDALLVDSWTGWSPDARRIAGSYDEEVTAWVPSCTTGCRPGGRWSSISLSQRQESNRLRVSGGLMPGAKGGRIRVRVQRLNGRKWVTVRKAVTRTSPISIYDVSLRRARYGTCRVLVSWAGNKAHKAATARTGRIIC